MERIEEIICSRGMTGFYFDDQAAIKAGAEADGFFYNGAPQTAKFQAIRVPGESLSVMLRLSDGQITAGDCCAPQYSGSGGRFPLFQADEFLPLIRNLIAPVLIGQSLDKFLPLAEQLEQVRLDGNPLHPAVRYGVSQALLAAVAQSTNRLPCEVLAEEFSLELASEPMRIFAQSGDNRYQNADKMIMKKIDVMPHGLINNISDKLGTRGEKLLEYVNWLRDRVLTKRTSPDYVPEFHIDVYGTIGIAFNNDTKKMANYIGELGKAAKPFVLRIEGPMDAGSREGQRKALAELRAEVKHRGFDVGIVADEWCSSFEDVKFFAEKGAADMYQVKTPVLGGLQNSVKAILYCKQIGLGTYLGGSCNETDLAARATVHVGLATKPSQILAKPGMGMDEGFMVVFNEMQRALALLKAKGRI